MTAAAAYRNIKQKIAEIATASGRNPEEISLVAVTKGRRWKEVLPLCDAGQRDFGESRLKELQAKIDVAPADLRWHFIGTLQKNKVRKVIESAFLIHSVDSLELARKISECSREAGHTTRLLLQVNVSGETSKHGMSVDGWRKAVGMVFELPAISVEGLMTMAPFADDENAVRACFSGLRRFLEELQREKQGNHPLRRLSMGMSRDYRIAIEEGATLLRIGSLLFEPE